MRGRNGLRRTTPLAQRVSVHRGAPGSLVGIPLPWPRSATSSAIILVVTAGFAFAVLSTKLTERVPVPVPAILLLAAATASELWPRLRHAPDRDGGAGRGRRADRDPLQRRPRHRLAPVPGLGRRDPLDRRPRHLRSRRGSSRCSPTTRSASLDPLRARRRRDRARPTPRSCSPCSGAARSPAGSGTILEGEAGFNDPAGIALMVGMIDLATHARQLLPRRREGVRRSRWPSVSPSGSPARSS